MLGNRKFKIVANVNALVRVVSDAREIIFLLRAELPLLIIFRADDFIFYPELYVVHAHDLLRPNFHSLRAEMIIGSLRAAFGLRAVVNNDVVGIKFKAFARQVILAHLAVGRFHGAGLRAVIVISFVTVERDTRRALRQLQDVSFVVDANELLLDVALCLVALEAVAFELNDINFTRRDEFAAARIINKVVALKHGGDGVAFLRLLRQLSLGGFDIVEQFLLLLGQLMFASLAPLIFNVIENFRARVRTRLINCLRRRADEQRGAYDAQKFFHRHSSSKISTIGPS